MFTLYSTTNCAYCPMVRKLLHRHKADYQEIKLDEKPKLRQSLIEITKRMEVPILMNEAGEFEVGFDLGKLTRFIRRGNGTT